MKLLNRPVGKVGVAASLALSLTGCVVYQEPPVTHTVYEGPPVVEPPLPPPAAPVVVTAPPVIITTPSVVSIRTESDFYEPLSPYGEWIYTGHYVRAWRPRQVEVGWRPYANGYWRHTDAGWYWASEEPWGWATYHYGRWDWTPHYGWIWVPQTQWAPAWVSWRSGAGYIGWAPLPPAARISVSGTVEFGDAVIGPRFVFVEERRILEPVRPRTVIVNNTTVINRTVNITKIKVVNHTVINEGPRTEVVERATGQRVNARPARELRHEEETQFVARKRNNGRDDDHRVAAPARLEATPATPVPPREVRSVNKTVEPVRIERPAEAQVNTEVREPAPRTMPARPTPGPAAREAVIAPVLPVAAKPVEKPVRIAPAAQRPAPRIEKAVEPVVAPAPLLTPPVREEKAVREEKTPAVEATAVRPEAKPVQKHSQPSREKNPRVEKPVEPVVATPAASPRNRVPEVDNRQLRPATVQVQPNPRAAVAKPEKPAQSPKEKLSPAEENKARARSNSRPQEKQADEKEELAREEGSK